MDMELAVVQLVAYVMLTLGSVTIAVVSLMFAYRQNFGWTPLALVTSHGLKLGPASKEHYSATLKFEVWNRRKYPIAIRHCDVAFSVLEFDKVPRDEAATEPEWKVWKKRNIHSREAIVLGPNDHKEFNVQAPFKRRTLDDLVDPIVITVSYFDPRKNRTYPISVKYTYHMGALDKKQA